MLYVINCMFQYRKIYTNNCRKKVTLLSVMVLRSNQYSRAIYSTVLIWKPSTITTTPIYFIIVTAYTSKFIRKDDWGHAFGLRTRTVYIENRAKVKSRTYHSPKSLSPLKRLLSCMWNFDVIKFHVRCSTIKCVRPFLILGFIWSIVTDE